MNLTIQQSNWEANSSFSETVPGLQLGIDSTSLGAFKTCPRFYQLSILEGWSPRAESVHLTFGLLIHHAQEIFAAARAKGDSYDDALDATIDWALRATWDSKLARPWVSDHPEKNRLSLLRAIVWYFDRFREAGDPLETVQLADGRPAVELSFRFDSGWRTSQGEPWIFCGHIDRIAQLGDRFYVADIKTSGRELSPKWFEGFTPGNQFSMYALAGSIAFNFDVEGVIVDGMQIGATFVRFQRGPIPRPKEVLSEWLAGTHYWLRNMEECATSGEWPMDDKSCDMWGGCQFRSVCSRKPGARPQWLAANFVRRQWDPMRARGDI